MFTLPLSPLWSLYALQARSRSGSITAVIVLCSSSVAETSLFWNQLDAFYRLMAQNVPHETSSVQPCCSPARSGTVKFMKWKCSRPSVLLLLSEVSGGFIMNRDSVTVNRLGSYSGQLSRMRSCRAPLSEGEQIYFRVHVSGGDSSFLEAIVSPERP